MLESLGAMSVGQWVLIATVFELFTMGMVWWVQAGEPWYLKMLLWTLIHLVSVLTTLVFYVLSWLMPSIWNWLGTIG